MISKIKMITFDLDDTLWDNKPTITNAEIETRNWIEERVGKVDWGNFSDFLSLREELIKKDKSIAWDIGKLRIEIFKEKIKGLVSSNDIQKISEDAFDYFLKKFTSLDLLKDKEFTLKDKPNETFIGKGIDNKGLLIAQNLKDQRIVKFSSGEVSLKLKK